MAADHVTENQRYTVFINALIIVTSLVRMNGVQMNFCLKSKLIDLYIISIAQVTG